MNLLTTELANVKEENQVLSDDCHGLLSKLKAKQAQTNNESELLIQSQQLQEQHKQEIERLQEKLQQTREDFKNMNKLRK